MQTYSEKGKEFNNQLQFMSFFERLWECFKTTIAKYGIQTVSKAKFYVRKIRILFEWVNITNIISICKRFNEGALTSPCQYNITEDAFVIKENLDISNLANNSLYCVIDGYQIVNSYLIKYK